LQSPQGTYSHQQSQSGMPSTLSTVRSVVRESSDSVSGNMAKTPSVQGMRAKTGAWALTRMLGNYLTESQEERMAETSRSKTAMTSQVFNPHGLPAMTATIFTGNLHKKEQTMLAQTGGNDPDSQNFFAQTQPETSEMGTQTEPLIENLSTSMMNMMALDGSEEGQEHIINQSEMSQPAQDDAKSGEEETYATNLWQDLQQTIEQDCLTEGQEHIDTMCLPSQNGIAEYQIRQIEKEVETICTQSQIGTIETQVAEDFRLRDHYYGYLSEAV
jgi:hypothetical protein